MKGRFAYDDSYEPPAPVLPLRVARPGGGEAVLLPGLLDTGADCTLVPAGIARRLRLPTVDRVEITGVGGSVRRVPVHAAFIETAGLRVLARVVAFEHEAIVGRDLLNHLVALLDGPRRRLALGPAVRRLQPPPAR